MKRFFPVLLLISVVLMLFCCSVLAETSGDFEYSVLYDGTIKISGYIGDAADLVIPETIDGYTVSALGNIYNSQFESVTSITIPNSLTKIASGALSFAKELREIHIADDHPTLAYQDGVLYNKEHKSILRYLPCNATEHFDVPEGIRIIEDSAFYKAQIVSITMPEGLEQIGNMAFMYCNSLENILIPSSLTEISEGCFFGCKSLTEIRVAPGNPMFAIIDDALINTRDKVLIAFPSNCDVETFTVPKSVTRIGQSAFLEAKNLKHVVFSEGLLEIGSMAFSKCENLMEANLPDSLNTIESMAFDGCSSLTYFHIPSCITKLNGEFDDTGITELTIPGTVTSIKRICHMKNLTEVVICSGAKAIGDNSFTYNKNLVCVTVPASVTKIGDGKNTFHDNAEDFYMKVEAGSYAERWCQKNDVRYTVIASSDQIVAENHSATNTTSAEMNVPANTASVVPTLVQETTVSRPPVAATGPLAEFATAFAQHADALEESFEIPCTQEIQELLFQDCSIKDTKYINAISIGEGMYKCSYQKKTDSIEFVNCEYYEGKRIVNAWKNHREADLTAREQETLVAAIRMVGGIVGTELQKEKAVHDILCQHVTYYDDGTSREHNENDCAVGAILNGQADCDGYSDAFYLLGSLTGLEVRLVKGDAVPDPDQLRLSSSGHVWNLVHVNGKWVMLDVTWDDREEDGICYTYFNTGTAMEAKRHIWEPQVMYLPVETDSSNDVRPSDLKWIQVSDWNSLRTILLYTLGRQERICLHYSSGLDLDAESKRFNQLIMTLGVKDFNWHFGGDNAEIYDVSMYPEYRVVSTRQEIVNYLAECRSRHPQEIRVYCPQDLFNRLIAGEGKAEIFEIMMEAGMKTDRLQHDDSGKYFYFIISSPEWN